MKPDRQDLRSDLERLGFFRYVDPANIDTVREGLLDNIINENAFFFPRGELFKNIDGRVFSFDGESLTEGGALDLFNDIRPSLEKAGLVIHEVDQVFDTNRHSRKPDYRFVLNDKTCHLGKTPAIPLLLWALVARKYVKFLNRAFRKGKINERLYFMNDACSDTNLALLTQEQVGFINSLKLNPRDRVYEVSYRSILKPVFPIVAIIIAALFKRKTKK